MNEAERAAWLAKRKQGIGSSDAAKVLGLSPFGGPLDVYLDKRGEGPPDVDNVRMQWGRRLEPVILDAYEDEKGVLVRDRARLIKSERWPFMLATIDGRAHKGDGQLVEAKTAASDTDSEGRVIWGQPGTDQIPYYYVPQVQHQLAVTLAPYCDVPVLIAGSDFRIYTVRPDAELIEMIADAEGKLWERIANGVPPEPTTLDAMRLRFRFDDGGSVEATDEIISTYYTALAQRVTLDAVEKAYDESLLTLQRFMGNAASLVQGGRTLATWRTSKPRRTFDDKQLKQDAPDLWAAYVRDGAAARPFLFKGEKSNE